MSEKENKVGVINKKTRSFFSDFKKFITKGNILDLAVAVVIGGAFGKIVSSLVKDIITPITGLFIRSGDLASLKWILKPAIAANEAAGIAETPEIAVTYGIFLQNVIDFLVIAFVVFVMLRVIVNLKAKLEHRETEAAKAKAQAEEKKKREEEAAAAAAAEVQENAQKKLYADITKQANILAEIRDIMLRNNQK